MTSARIFQALNVIFNLDSQHSIFALARKRQCICAHARSRYYSSSTSAVSIYSLFLLYLCDIQDTNHSTPRDYTARRALCFPSLQRPFLFTFSWLPSSYSSSSPHERARTLAPLKATCQLIPTSPVRYTYFEQLETR